MLKKLINLARWILVIPLMVIVGGLVNLSILSIVRLFGEELFSKLFYIPLEYILFPAVIGFFIVRYGPLIAPEYSIKTLNKAFKLLIVFEIVSIWLLAPNTALTKDFPPVHVQIIKSFFSIVGGLVGIYVFKKSLIKTKKI